MTIRWGILGASRFARQFMGPAIHAARGASLDALATSSRDKAAGFTAFRPGLRLHTSYEALLDDPEIDAVYIPLPNTLHVQWALKALGCGKHVLVEKPAAMSAGEIGRLIAARDRSGLLAAEAFMIVHHPQWQRARHLVQDGAIGRLRHAEGLFCYYNDDKANIRNSAKLGGGGIRDIGIYTYGSTRFASGEEVEQITHAEAEFENGVDVMASVSARFASFSAHWVTSTRMHPAQVMTFVGDKGVIRLSAPFNANVFGEARVELHQDSLGMRVERFPAASHYVLQAEAFSHSAATGEPYSWPLEQARGTQTVIDAVFDRLNT